MGATWRASEPVVGDPRRREPTRRAGREGTDVVRRVERRIERVAIERRGGGDRAGNRIDRRPDGAGGSGEAGVDRGRTRRAELRRPEAEERARVAVSASG